MRQLLKISRRTSLKSRFVLSLSCRAGGESYLLFGRKPQVIVFCRQFGGCLSRPAIEFRVGRPQGLSLRRARAGGNWSDKRTGRAAGQTNFSQGIAVFRNYPAGSKITVFTSEGRRVATVVTDKEGCAQLDMREQPAGIYIINVGKRSFKWLKN